MKLTETRVGLNFAIYGIEFEKSMLSGGNAVNIKRFLFIFVLAAGLIPVSRPVFAHHSVAEFDMGNVSNIKGTVTKYEWTNPHAYIYLEVKDDKGATEEWMAELGSLGMLARANWKKDPVKPGDQITVYGNRAKDGRFMIHIDHIVFPNGQELSARIG